MSARRPEVLWCENRRRRSGNGWCFPPAVERKLRELTAGRRVGHLFGGLSKFGTKLDMDPTTKPHVLGDAWMAPFVRDAFDVVILDPPYLEVNQHMYLQLLTQAAWCAREHVIWFHTLWLANGRAGRLEHAWLVRVGDMCAARVLQVFRVPAEKREPVRFFDRGPAVRYNRWIAGQDRLPFPRLPRRKAS
jgi:hypothetical protein